MKIIAYLVTKNEAGRYLEKTLDCLQEHVDGLFVYDDRSDDGTLDILKDRNVSHLIRPESLVSFEEDEAEFRQQAWMRMEKLLKPRDGDWVLSLDADEVLRTAVPLKEVCADAGKRGYGGLSMHVHEMWEPDQIRTDGFWGEIRAARLVAYMAGSRFRTFETHRFGGGSLPVFTGPVDFTERVDLLHFGYTRPEDRRKKFERYDGTAGHNPRHIRSILSEPTLANLPPLV